VLKTKMNYNIMIMSTKYIPSNEIKFTFARSSGAGGQNVNKTATKVIVCWRVGESRIFNQEEKTRIRIKLANRLNHQDEIVLASEEERTQAQNRRLAIARLQFLVNKAILSPKKRRPTRPTKTSKIKRLESKKKHSNLKKVRQKSVGLSE
jgi:ribosome-associated protein